MKVFAEFERAGDARRALKTLTSLGYPGLETYAPFPLTDEEAHAPRGAFPLAFLACGGGLTGLAAAYLVQWWANVQSYPLNIGGRPAHAAAAFVPASFETVCLLATLGVFAGFLLLERLPRFWQPVFEIDGFERSTIDRFWIAFDIADTSAQVERVREDMAPLHPLRIVVSEDIT